MYAQDRALSTSSSASVTPSAKELQEPILLAQATPSATTPQDAAAQPPAASAAPAPPAALTTPAMTGPLQDLPPGVFDAGFLGKLSANGIISGSGLWQGYPIPGDNPNAAALSNGQAWVQKTDGWYQFYVQAGAYTLPDLATPFLATDKTVTDFFGPVPVAYFKVQPGKNTSFLIGALPTLIGAEYTFSFQNMNVERGLLWNQENAVNRGIQVNQTMGKFSASLSWNDGFYSNRYTWLSGSLAYVNGPHALSFVAGGNYGKTAFQTLATPVQNNSSIYNVIYTYTKGPLILQPYFQYSNLPTNANIGVVKGASTTGGAILVNYNFKHGFSLPARWEYIASSGSVAEESVNLISGPGSAATSITVTPTIQKGGFFARGDLSLVHVTSYVPGSAFGPNGTNQNQPRAMGEIGFIFGNNILPK
jgi:Putative beta-barrel porin-2, OmpL-like. bbp2